MVDLLRGIVFTEEYIMNGTVSLESSDTGVQVQLCDPRFPT